MAINVSGMLQGLGSSLSQIGSQGISAEYQRQRDLHMSKYRQKEQQQGHTNALELQENRFEAQGIVADKQATAKAQAATLERDQELADMDRREAHDMRKLAYKAKNDPSGVKVTTNIGAEESEYDKTVGRERAKADTQLETDTKAAMKSSRGISDALDIMRDIQSKFPTGKSEELMARAGQWLGTDAGKAMQTWEGVAAPMVLAQAESLTGVLSDRDMQILYDTVPSFGKEPGANKIIMDLMAEGVKRAKENNRSMQAYKRREGGDGSIRGWEPPYTKETVSVLGSLRSSQSSGGQQPTSGNLLDMFDQFEQENYGGN